MPKRSKYDLFVSYAETEHSIWPAFVSSRKPPSPLAPHCRPNSNAPYTRASAHCWYCPGLPGRPRRQLHGATDPEQWSGDLHLAGDATSEDGAVFRGRLEAVRRTAGEDAGDSGEAGRYSRLLRGDGAQATSIWS
jgi:hypothetical protein